jgi:hypothetical protein
MTNLIKAAYKVKEDNKGSGLFWFSNEEYVSIDDPGRIFDRIWIVAQKGKDGVKSVVE